MSLNPTLAGCTRCNIMWSSLSVTCHSYGFFPVDAPGSSNKTDHHNIAEMWLNTITLPFLHLRLLIDVFAQLLNSGMVIYKQVIFYIEYCVSAEIIVWQLLLKYINFFILDTICMSLLWCKLCHIIHKPKKVWYISLSFLNWVAKCDSMVYEYYLVECNYQRVNLF